VERVQGTTHSTGHVPTEDNRPATFHRKHSTRLHLAARRRTTCTVQPLRRGSADHERLRSDKHQGQDTYLFALDDLIQSNATGDFYQKQTTTTQPKTYISKEQGHQPAATADTESANNKDTGKLTPRHGEDTGPWRNTRTYTSKGQGPRPSATACI
jgi:hypothetical protein